MVIHESHETFNKDNQWLKLHRWLTYIALGIIGYYLLAEHRRTPMELKEL